MDDRAELIERLEKLTGPDREVDARIAKLVADLNFGWCGDDGWLCGDCDAYGPYCGKPLGLSDERGSYPIDWREDERLPAYTASLDAAVALVEKVKPGWKKQILEGRSGNWIARVSSPRYETSSTDYMREREPDGAPNGAIALLLALLRSDKEAG